MGGVVGLVEEWLLKETELIIGGANSVSDEVKILRDSWIPENDQNADYHENLCYADYHENYDADNHDDDLCPFVWVGGWW